MTPSSLSDALTSKQPVHFIGIGGIGMSALAKLLLEAGYSVSGSDNKDNPLTHQLKIMGAHIYVGHDAHQVPANGLVVVSTAITESNPEYQAAKQSGLPVIHRSDLLKELLQGSELGHQQVIGVAGTHGKTTITGMIAQVLLQADRDPTVIAGGILPSIHTNAIWGKSRSIAVAELDESDGSILRYTPTHLILANLELDHPDHYPGGFAQIIRTFETALAQIPAGGMVVYNQDCEATTAVVTQSGKHLKGISVSLKDASADYCVYNPVFQTAGYSAKILHQQTPLGVLQLQVPGKHNLMNALLTTAICHQINVAFELIQQALLAFHGMGRRFERLSEPNGVLLVDDYGHHPTEVLATLSAAKELARQRGGKVGVVFQPHRFSRLQSLWSEFTTAFRDADDVYITDVYSAGETPIDGVTAQCLSQEARAQYVPKTHLAQFATQLLGNAKTGDVLISMGAGDITQLFREASASANV